MVHSHTHDAGPITALRHVHVICSTVPLQGISLECLSAQVSHNVGQCATLYELLYSEKKSSELLSRQDNYTTLDPLHVCLHLRVISHLNLRTLSLLDYVLAWCVSVIHRITLD